MRSFERGASVTLYQKPKRVLEGFLHILLYASATITFLLLFLVLFSVLSQGLPYLSVSFLTSTYSEVDSQKQGILPMLINTLYMVVGTLTFSVPIGIGSAIYLTQYAKQGRLVDFIRFTTEVLSGIPSILFGLFGYAVFCIFFSLGTSILAGCLTLSLMVLPIIIRTTEEALMAVPSSYRDGALALGAGKLRVILGVLLPTALPGVMTSVILAMGRVVSESAALLYTAGMAYQMPRNLLGHFLDSGRTLTLHLYTVSKQAVDPNAYHIAFATGSVLLILIFLLNLLANGISQIFRRKRGAG